jgi:glyoxylase-like metal-dependent hydrolase (beta-lactamase superfamily II)
MISVKTFVFNPFAENTFIIYDDSGECAIIDPGCYGKDEEEQLLDFIANNNLKPVLLLNTHCHIDHVLGNKFIKEHFNLELHIPEHDKTTYDAVPSYASVYGFPDYQHSAEDQLIKENDLIKFGHSVLKVVFVPGHTAGHIAFVNTEDNLCLAGDVLFEGSIGRTDLPGGDFDTLISSIRTKLFTYPDEMTVYPGHGPTTTIGREKRHNPFCAVD